MVAEGAFFLSRVYCSAMILELLTLRRRIKITRFDGANVMQHSTYVKDFKSTISNPIILQSKLGFANNSISQLSRSVGNMGPQLGGNFFFHI